MAVRLASLCLCALLAVLAGCGDDDGGGPGPIQGAFVRLFGSQSKTFSLEPGGARLTCRPKPGLKEFEVNAELLQTDAGSSFKLILKDWAGKAGRFDLEYSVGGTQHTLEVSVGSAYRYKFFQAFRTDNTTAYNSRCSVDLAAEEQGDATKYSTALYCVMLWADTSSKDYRSSTLNAFVDLVAKFECSY